MIQAGTFAIPNLAQGGTVTGLDLAAVPRRVFPRVRKPAGGLNMFANVIDTTITADGFQFDLSAQTDNANYRLDYLIFT